MNTQVTNKPTKALDNIDISLEQRLIYDKLTFYYISLPILLLGNIFGSLLLVAIQLNSIDLYSLSIWLLVSFIMFSYQAYHYSLFKRESEDNKLKNANIWLDKYYTNILLNGIIWGSSAFLLFPNNDITHQMVVIIFLFAIGFSSMGVLASKKDLLLTYVLATYSPLILRLFFLDNSFYTKIAYVILALMLLMILVANYYGKIINQSLGNRQHFITIKHTHEKLKERFFSLFERAPVGIYYYNENLELQDVNLHFMKMHSITDKEELLNLQLKTLISSTIIDAHQQTFEGKTGHYRGPYETFDENSNLYVNLSTVPMLNANGDIAGGIAIVNDITSEVTAKEKMVRNAYYDMLTNIPNRTLLMDKLKKFLSSRAGNKEFYSALLVLDIDNFKKVNETYGHDVGDNLLKQVVHRLEDTTKSNDIFARISGNKFVILNPLVHEEKDTAKTITLEYIDQIEKHFSRSLHVAGEEYHVSFSIGTLIFNNEKTSAFDILKCAETAMYEVKKNARGTNLFYHDNMSNTSKEELSLENDIHKAILNNEFMVYYQPQLDVKTNQIIGAEALVRWNHPIKGFISPAIFVPIAEESGTIIKLEEWIFNNIFSSLHSIFEKNKESNLKHIAINLSTMHFLQPHFVEKLMLLVQEHQIKPEWVEIEITETGLIHSLSDAVNKIEELKAFGFKFSIDDFGTGYSSLAYLKRLPVNMIKIDQTFVMNMQDDAGDTMIVKSAVDIGKTFNLKVLAEGVETKEALVHLSAIGCDYYQGYYAHKPMPLKDFKKLLN